MTAAAITDAWIAARAAWANVDVAEGVFARWVADRGGHDGESIATLNTRDLYLACACSRGDATALATFDARFASSIDTALGSLRMGDDHRDEIRQRLRTKLFVGEHARIAAYSGRGELGGWVRVAAIREALDLLREDRREAPYEDPLAALSSVPVADPALAALKERYSEPMKAAFRNALADLPVADRSLLRYKYVDGASLDDIAVIQRVHRATIARRLRDLRDELARRTRDRLMAELGVGRDDAESIIRLVHSQIDASLAGLAD